MLTKTRITLVHAAHAVPLPLVSFADKRGLEGIVIDVEMPVKRKIGKPPCESRTINWAKVSCIQVKWRQS